MKSTQSAWNHQAQRMGSWYLLVACPILGAQCLLYSGPEPGLAVQWLKELLIPC